MKWKPNFFQWYRVYILPICGTENLWVRAFIKERCSDGRFKITYSEKCMYHEKKWIFTRNKLHILTFWNRPHVLFSLECVYYIKHVIQWYMKTLKKKYMSFSTKWYIYQIIRSYNGALWDFGVEYTHFIIVWGDQNLCYESHRHLTWISAISRQLIELFLVITMYCIRYSQVVWFNHSNVYETF